MIKVCKFNKYHDEIVNFLEKNNANFSSEECLLRCDLCHSGAFVKMDSEFIFDENVDTFLGKLKIML
jgi:uncharacterized protein YuzB (UPF0349 family)